MSRRSHLVQTLTVVAAFLWAAISTAHIAIGTCPRGVPPGGCRGGRRGHSPWLCSRRVLAPSARLVASWVASVIVEEVVDYLGITPEVRR